jgi:hypothetical protein
LTHCGGGNFPGGIKTKKSKTETRKTIKKEKVKLLFWGEQFGFSG